MLVNHNGNEYFVTNKLTLEQLLKNGAVLVEDGQVAEEIEPVKETVAKVEFENKKPPRKK